MVEFYSELAEQYPKFGYKVRMVYIMLQHLAINGQLLTLCPEFGYKLGHKESQLKYNKIWV